MRVGIITFHRAANYGAVLQSYALVSVLRSLGADAEIIDYDNFRIRRYYYPINPVNFVHPKALIRDVFGIRKHFLRNFHFRRFREEYLILSSKRFTERKMPDGKEYDLVISGSDQVWNFDCNGKDTCYFLGSIDSSVPCVSYAASMAKVQLNDFEEQLYKKLLEKFLCISVREAGAAELLQPLTSKKISVSPDPTLLLTKEDWNKIEKKPKEQNYIFVFMIGNSNKVMLKARELSQKTGCELVCIHMDNIKYEHRWGTIFPCSPDKWLGYIKNAKYVITDSFHGTVFSVIFQKNFTSLVKVDAGKNSRINSLLKELNLENRAVSELGDKIPDEIDYNKVEPLLENYRSKGLEYLKEIISNIKEK